MFSNGVKTKEQMTLKDWAIVVALTILFIGFVYCIHSFIDSICSADVEIEEYEKMNRWIKHQPSLKSLYQEKRQDGKIEGREFIEIEREYKKLKKQSVMESI